MTDTQTDDLDETEETEPDLPELLDFTLLGRLSEKQVDVLMANLNKARVATRKQGGRDLSYLQSYDVKATLIRVFGFGGFSAECIDTRILSTTESEMSGKTYYTVCALCTVKLRIHATAATYSESAAASQKGPDIGEVTDFAVKGLGLDTPIPTPDGWSTMGALRVGDTVFDRHGQPTRVAVKSEVKDLPCYRVTFRDGAQIVCDEEHFWFARNGLNSHMGVWNIRDLYATKAMGGSVAMPVGGALHTDNVALPIDPWLTGYWIGNGDSSGGRLTCHEDDADFITSQVVGFPTRVSHPNPSRAATIRVGDSVPGSRSGLTAALRHAGMTGHKSIPDLYLRAGLGQRLALLQGLVDSDGHIAKSGVASFTSVRKDLAMQVAELVRSLGDRVAFTEYQAAGFGDAVTAYRVDWTPTMCPARVPRKVARFKGRIKDGSHRVASIEKTVSVPTQCIGVESPSKSYLAGETMVPTHNTAESDALKRAATYLGTAFGLSLYDNGTTRDVVRVVYAPDQLRLPQPPPPAKDDPAVQRALGQTP